MAKKGQPQAPDPIKLIQEQTKSNIGTAVAQTNLNQTDQSTPFGSVKYSQIGTNADGTPKYAVDQQFSAPVRAMFDRATGTGPLDLSNDATEARLIELGRSRLDPMLTQRRQETETDLINRGIRPGSAAYQQAHDIANQGENDAFNSLILNGHQQAVSDALAQHNSPINDFLALSGQGGQLATPQTGVAGTDVAGIQQQAYQTANQNWQQQQSDLMGGLFGLGKAAIGLFSDERLKTDIQATGAKVAGVPVKTWKWKGTGEPGVGVVAQDAERHHPSVVHRDPATGYRRVNYARLMMMGRAA